MNYQDYLHNIIVECIRNINRQNICETFNPRNNMPKVRGGWNKDKILRYLKATPSYHGNHTAAKFIAEFDNVNELKEHIFWHGSPFFQTQLKPSITKSKRWAETYGGGGYGKQYWGISLTSNKYTATRFAGTAHGVNVHPVVLAKNAVVKELPEVEDAIEVEDLIVQLYTEGIDAVYIGGKGYGEEELLVINPKAICNMDAAQYFKCYQLFKDKVPMPTDKQLQELLTASKEYVSGYKDTTNKPTKPLKPIQPSKFYLDGEHAFTKKPDETYDQEVQNYNQQLSDYEKQMKDYEKQLDDFNNSEETKLWNKRKEELRNKMRI